MEPMAMLLVRHSQMLRRLVESLLLIALMLGGCSDPPAPPAVTQPTTEVSTTREAAAPQPTAIRFTDVTAAAGVVFQHEAGATEKKWYPETMGTGGGFFDYDGDGLPDILLVNGRQWAGERHSPEPTMQ
jgi:hypothetical protein